MKTRQTKRNESKKKKKKKRDRKITLARDHLNVRIMHIHVDVSNNTTYAMESLVTTVLFFFFSFSLSSLHLWFVQRWECVTRIRNDIFFPSSHIFNFAVCFVLSWSSSPLTSHQNALALRFKSTDDSWTRERKPRDHTHWLTQSQVMN